MLMEFTCPMIVFYCHKLSKIKVELLIYFKMIKRLSLLLNNSIYKNRLLKLL